MINASGRYVIPGLIDTNIHLDLHYNMTLFPLLVYGGEDAYLEHSLAAEGAQVALKHGVTTILDTYGPLLPLMKLRDRLKSGEIVGPRLLVAGNIIGWDGPLSASESRRAPADVKPWEQDHDAWFTQGTGAALTQMYADEVADAVRKYIDLGPDFIKVGITTHYPSSPITLSFSPEVLATIVKVAHAKGLKVQAHSGTVEGHRASVAAGIDIITHAETLYSQRLRPDFARNICNTGAYFALFGYASLPAYKYLRSAAGAGTRRATNLDDKIKVIESITPDRDRKQWLPEPLRTHLPASSDDPSTAFRLENQKVLLEAGCKIIVASDSHPAKYEDIVGHNECHADMGAGTLDSIEGLVTQVGMTPAQAIIAATRDAAAATGLIAEIGTIEEGKHADLLVLDANPLSDISNIRKLVSIIHDGMVIDPATLPSSPKFYRR